MVDKRVGGRLRKRLKVKYVENEKQRMGYTDDFSEEGLFIRSTSVLPPNSVLTMEFEIDEGDKVVAEGRVRWARRLPAQVLYKAKGGMGVRFSRFHSGEKSYRNFLERLRKKR